MVTVPKGHDPTDDPMRNIDKQLLEIPKNLDILSVFSLTFFRFPLKKKTVLAPGKMRKNANLAVLDETAEEAINPNG